MKFEIHGVQGGKRVTAYAEAASLSEAIAKASGRGVEVESATVQRDADANRHSGPGAAAQAGPGTAVADARPRQTGVAGTGQAHRPEQSGNAPTQAGAGARPVAGGPAAGTGSPPLGEPRVSPAPRQAAEAAATAAQAAGQPPLFPRRGWVFALIGSGAALFALFAIAFLTSDIDAPRAAAGAAATPRVTSSQPLPAHVVRAADGSLSPEAGYTWGSGGPSSGQVQWTPGAAHPGFPHIRSADQEGYWSADPGYAFPSKDSLQVAWTPGRLHPRHKVVASSPEGSWRPADGYGWVNPADPNSLEVRWVPNKAHSTAAHVVAGDVEGKWSPAAGYRWANTTPGDLSVVASGPSEEQLQSAAVKVVLALVAHQASIPRSSDNLLTDIAREAARSLRDEAIKSSLADLFPGERPLALSAAANMIILGAEGRLTANNWTSATTQDELVRRLRQQDPSAADAAALADFVGRVIDAYDRRH